MKTKIVTVVQEYKTAFKKEREGGRVFVQQHAGPSGGRKILYLSCSNQYLILTISQMTNV